MLASIAADSILVLHVAFVAFVALGGVLVLRWSALAWLHLPAVAWGALIEFAGWTCPLTPLEVALREASGERGYHGDFLQHYLVSFLYPGGLTRGLQIGLGALVVLINGAFYLAIMRRARLR
jgi:hypothetical protein